MEDAGTMVQEDRGMDAGTAGAAGAARAPRRRGGFSPLGVATLVAAVPLLSLAYFHIGSRYLGSRLGFGDYLVFCTVLAASVTGFYQLYFWMQDNNRLLPVRRLATPLDEMIPFAPSWVWVYSLMYYVLIGFAATSISSLREGLNHIFGGAVLLLMHGACATLVPSTVPARWRAYEAGTLSRRFLKFIQGIDNGRNCWPSMHCALATYLCCLMQATLGPGVFVLAALVAVSCLLVKQHQIADVVPGAALGWIASVVARSL